MTLKKKRVGVRLTIVLMSSFVVGTCSSMQTAFRDAIQVITNGIDDINRNSALWADVLQRVADDLPQEVAEVIREEAQNIATRSIAQAGTQFGCSVDFLGRRAKQALERLKQALGGSMPPPLPPLFCLVAPPAIDLNTDPSGWGTITLHGYDLDHRDGEGNLLGFALTGSSESEFQALPASLIGRTTHYQITLNVHDVAATLHDKRIAKIVPLWQGQIEGSTSGEILVQAWRPKRMVRLHEPGKTTWVPPQPLREIELFGRKLQGKPGDEDFDTGRNDPMSVRVEAEIIYEDTLVAGRVFMWAREHKGDHTEVEGWSDWGRIFNAPSGWKIVRVTPSSRSSYSAQITDHGLHTYNRPAGEVVLRFNVWGDHIGNDAGGYTRVEADWSPLQIEVEEVRPSWY